MVKDSENVVTLDYDYGQYYEKQTLNQNRMSGLMPLWLWEGHDGKIKCDFQVSSRRHPRNPWFIPLVMWLQIYVMHNWNGMLSCSTLAILTGKERLAKASVPNPHVGIRDTNCTVTAVMPSTITTRHGQVFCNHIMSLFKMWSKSPVRGYLSTGLGYQLWLDYNTGLKY